MRHEGRVTSLSWIPSEAVGPGLVYVQKWPAEHWKLAFQGERLIHAA